MNPPRFVRFSMLMVATLSLASCQAICSDSPPPTPMLEFRLWWNENDGLSAGAPLVYKELTVGTVNSVRLEPHPLRPGNIFVAYVAIDSLQYANILDARMSYLVEERPDPDGPMVLIADTERSLAARTPVLEGDLVAGDVRPWDPRLAVVRKFFDDAASFLRDLDKTTGFSESTNQLFAQIAESTDSESRTKLLDQLKDQSDSIAESLSEKEEEALEFYESIVKKK